MGAQMLDTHTPTQSAALAARAIALAAQRTAVLSHYTQVQQDAALHLYNLVKRNRDTGGGIRVTKFLLSLYNGDRFQFDLTDFRALDDDAFKAALMVLEMDARRRWCEIHVLLNAILGGNADAGAEFEHWAYDLGLKGRCKKHMLPALPVRAMQ
jgi:hypothetical protein